jgi:hypothetical protein
MRFAYRPIDPTGVQNAPGRTEATCVPAAVVEVVEVVEAVVAVELVEELVAEPPDGALVVGFQPRMVVPAHSLFNRLSSRRHSL